MSFPLVDANLKLFLGRHTIEFNALFATSSKLTFEINCRFRKQEEIIDNIDGTAIVKSCVLQKVLIKFSRKVVHL